MLKSVGLLCVYVCVQLEHFFFFQLKMRAVDFSEMHRIQKMDPAIDFHQWGTIWIRQLCESLQQSNDIAVANAGGNSNTSFTGAGAVKSGDSKTEVSMTRPSSAGHKPDPATVQRWSSTLVQDNQTGQWVFSIIASSQMKSNDMLVRCWTDRLCVPVFLFSSYD